MHYSNPVICNCTALWVAVIKNESTNQNLEFKRSRCEARQSMATSQYILASIIYMLLCFNVCLMHQQIVTLTL